MRFDGGCPCLTRASGGSRPVGLLRGPVRSDLPIHPADLGDGPRARRRRRFSALEPETFWWALATFTHLIIRSVKRYHDPGELDAAGFEHLYADIVAWHERYGVSMCPVPATLDDFRVTFDRFCVERLERTEAVERLLQPDDRPRPVSGGGPLERLTAPILRRWGTLSTIGNLPPSIRERLGFDWTPPDQERLDRMATTLRWTFEAMPPAVNRTTFTTALRRTGAQTRSDRYAPTLTRPAEAGSREPCKGL